MRYMTSIKVITYYCFKTSRENKLADIWIDVNTKNVVPYRSAHISQTTLPQVSSTQWQMIMTFLTSIMYMSIAICRKKAMQYM